ncbi:MAG TPA: hypothetical protein VFE76_05245, partial [Myxococcales bacterium]|nr:hypothetical protein [Myxococcales bacterium]
SALRSIGSSTTSRATIPRAERHRLTLEGLADIDAGQVIDHQAVQAWAESLGTRRPRPIPHR